MWDCFQGTNLSFNLLIILVFLTENPKPETENGIRGQGPVRESVDQA